MMPVAMPDELATGLPARPAITLHRLSGAFRTTAEGTARHDGLFDIFPESYWSRFSVLRQVSLRCRLRAPARLRLVRRHVAACGETPWAQETVVCDLLCTEGEAVLSVPLAPPDAPDSLLLLEVCGDDAAVPDGLLCNAVWETDEPPARTVRLGLAITTFNREAFLVANLTRLHGRMAGGCAIIVNHGAPGLEARLRNQLAVDPAIRWIDQENSGGAGGFTRGICEHREAGDVSHVMLMDDDIDMPADLVERTHAILSYSRPEVCLGGAMFDYHDRTRLFSAGDMLMPGSFGISHIAPPEGCDIATPGGVDFLARVHRPDFNGWWCFAFPIAAVDTVGLPMPCFIRGDDVEFGYRLKRAGMPTLGWPGLAVWHMPFADKSAPWHMFYDRRNSLFANARHRRVGRIAAIGKLVGGFTHHLLRYDYDRVRAMTLGIAAFNRGAGAMAGWTHHDHAALLAATSAMAAPDSRDWPVDDTQGRPARENDGRPFDAPRLSGPVRSLRMTGRLACDLTGMPVGRALPHVLSPGTAWRPDLTCRPAVAVECDARGRPVRIFRRDPAEARRATWRFVRALAGMALRFNQSADTPPARTAKVAKAPLQFTEFSGD